MNYNTAHGYAKFTTAKGKYYRAIVMYKGHFRTLVRRWETASQAQAYGKRLMERITVPEKA